MPCRRFRLTRTRSILPTSPPPCRMPAALPSIVARSIGATEAISGSRDQGGAPVCIGAPKAAPNTTTVRPGMASPAPSASPEALAAGVGMASPAPASAGARSVRGQARRPIGGCRSRRRACRLRGARWRSPRRTRVDAAGGAKGRTGVGAADAIALRRGDHVAQGAASAWTARTGAPSPRRVRARGNRNSGGRGPGPELGAQVAVDGLRIESEPRGDALQRASTSHCRRALNLGGSGVVARSRTP